MSTIFYGALVALQRTDDGLTFAEILGNVPTDPASLFVLGLLAATFGFVLWAGTRKGKGKGGGTPIPS